MFGMVEFYYRELAQEAAKDCCLSAEKENVLCVESGASYTAPFADFKKIIGDAVHTAAIHAVREYGRRPSKSVASRIIDGLEGFRDELKEKNLLSECVRVLEFCRDSHANSCGEVDRLIDELNSALSNCQI